MCLMSVGCSRGFHRTDLQDQLRSGAPEFASDQPGEVITADDIKAAFAARPQLKKPFRLAIYFDNPGARWSEHERMGLQRAGDRLQELKVISDYLLLTDLLVDGNAPLNHTNGQAGRQRFAQIRLAAAKANADAVLVVRKAADVDRYSNPFSLLYLTVIGFYVAPGSNADALVMVEGALVDVRNGVVYASAQAEGEDSIIRPLAYLENDDVVRGASNKAMDAFAKEISDHILALR